MEVNIRRNPIVGK